MKIYITFISILLSSLVCYGASAPCPVKIIPTETRYQTAFSNNRIIQLNYVTLVNPSTEAYYFWIGREPSTKVDTERSFYRYFYGKKDLKYEVSFGEILADGADALINPGKQEIGYNFIKLLEPGEKFIIIMPSEKSSAEFIMERFVFMEKSDLERRVGIQIKNFQYLPSVLDLSTALSDSDSIATSVSASDDAIESLFTTQQPQKPQSIWVRFIDWLRSLWKSIFG